MRGSPGSGVAPIAGGVGGVAAPGRAGGAGVAVAEGSVLPRATSAGPIAEALGRNPAANNPASKLLPSRPPAAVQSSGLNGLNAAGLNRPHLERLASGPAGLNDRRIEHLRPQRPE